MIYSKAFNGGRSGGKFGARGGSKIIISLNHIYKEDPSRYQNLVVGESLLVFLNVLIIFMSKILYFGAASGTTASNADIVGPDKIFMFKVMKVMVVIFIQKIRICDILELIYYYLSDELKFLVLLIRSKNNNDNNNNNDISSSKIGNIGNNKY
ncbi:hypothetical protein Glove_155g103 [Diversispora epigaea]|uniref:Uncharacterized protein n=1 Tax=Diversispora epigaea TaxID=1348612 RepID=A0A397IS72_9GLOM|nr:hypothetical protein Glove_155g103 [Diversispora epigaea]